MGGPGSGPRPGKGKTGPFSSSRALGRIRPDKGGTYTRRDRRLKNAISKSTNTREFRRAEAKIFQRSKRTANKGFK